VQGGETKKNCVFRNLGQTIANKGGAGPDRKKNGGLAKGEKSPKGVPWSFESRDGLGFSIQKRGVRTSTRQKETEQRSFRKNSVIGK